MPLPVTHRCAQPPSKAATADDIWSTIAKRIMAADNSKKADNVFAEWSNPDGGTKDLNRLENYARRSIQPESSRAP